MDVQQDIKHASSPVNSISFCPAGHTAEPFRTDAGLKVPSGEEPSLALLRTVARQQHELCSELLHTSLPRASNALQDILPQRNGFVHTVIEAYNRHRALIVRPDDVWLAILIQFCFFVNGNAEALRSAFVAHEGKKELVIYALGNRYTMDPAHMARQMTGLMQEHIVDPSLREWIMPSFTTTTTLDKSISAIVMMGTMKEYFTYTFGLACGIPKVTIEGEKSDWEEILRRLERLKQYGAEITAWYHLLRPVISRFVAAYDDPNSPGNLDFWSKVAHMNSGGSGPTWLSGWITTFCAFNENGKWQGRVIETDHFSMEATPYLALDGTPYPRIDSAKIPCGYTYVDVNLNDNGEVFDTMFVTGLVGSQICTTEKTASSESRLRNTVRPLSAWWYFIKGEKPKTKRLLRTR